MTEQTEAAAGSIVLPIRDDLLQGADAIAAFLGVKRRRVYLIAERGALPIFTLSGRLMARKSTLARAIEVREAAASGDTEAA